MKILNRNFVLGLMVGGIIMGGVWAYFSLFDEFELNLSQSGAETCYDVCARQLSRELKACKKKRVWDPTRIGCADRAWNRHKQCSEDCNRDPIEP